MLPPSQKGRYMSLKRVAALAVLVLAPLVPAFAATNLLVNPKFDVGVIGWRPYSVGETLGWQQNLDAFHSATSGSATLTYNFLRVPTSGVGIKQCVQVTPGTYDAAVKVMLPGGQIPLTANGGVFFYDTSDCSGGSSGAGALFPDVTALSNGAFTSIAARNIVAPSTIHSALFAVYMVNKELGTATVNFDDAVLQPSGGCVSDDVTACLDGGRFALLATFTAPGAAPASAHMIQLTPDSVDMWFFTANNIEMTAKVLNACTVNGLQWVFAAGTTNVKVTLTVMDTSTGLTKIYTNAQGNAFQPVLDTAAFSCP
jgi:hypothetical protein